MRVRVRVRVRERESGRAILFLLPCFVCVRAREQECKEERGKMEGEVGGGGQGGEERNREQGGQYGKKQRFGETDKQARTPP